MACWPVPSLRTEEASLLRRRWPLSVFLNSLPEKSSPRPAEVTVRVGRPRRLPDGFAPLSPLPSASSLCNSEVTPPLGRAAGFTHSCSQGLWPLPNRVGPPTGAGGPLWLGTGAQSTPRPAGPISGRLAPPWGAGGCFEPPFLLRGIGVRPSSVVSGPISFPARPLCSGPDISDPAAAALPAVNCRHERDSNYGVTGGSRGRPPACQQTPGVCFLTRSCPGPWVTGSLSPPSTVRASSCGAARTPVLAGVRPGALGGRSPSHLRWVRARSRGGPCRPPRALLRSCRHVAVTGVSLLSCALRFGGFALV